MTGVKVGENDSFTKNKTPNSHANGIEVTLRLTVPGKNV
jgi:hypothetical protein